MPAGIISPDACTEPFIDPPGAVVISRVGALEALISSPAATTLVPPTAGALKRQDHKIAPTPVAPFLRTNRIGPVAFVPSPQIEQTMV